MDMAFLIDKLRIMGQELKIIADELEYAEDEITEEDEKIAEEIVAEYFENLRSKK